MNYHGVSEPSSCAVGRARRASRRFYFFPLFFMETHVQKGHYGWHAESRDGKTIYRTMKTHGGWIVTSVWAVMSENNGIIGITPTGTRHVWTGSASRVTEKTIRTAHTENMAALLDTFRNHPAVVETLTQGPRECPSLLPHSSPPPCPT